MAYLLFPIHLEPVLSMQVQSQLQFPCRRIQPGKAGRPVLLVVGSTLKEQKSAKFEVIKRL